MHTRGVVIDRRMFLGAMAAGLLFSPFASEAQPGAKMWQVGFLTGGGRPPDGAPPLAFRQALQELGYVEGQNVAYVSRWANAKQDRLPGLAAELVGLNVHAIVTVGGPATDAAKTPTANINWRLVTTCLRPTALAQPAGNRSAIRSQRSGGGSNKRSCWLLRSNCASPASSAAQLGQCSRCSATRSRSAAFSSPS